MQYKKFFICIICAFLMSLLGRLFLGAWIDPMGIWNAPIISGFNHYKVKRIGYLDVWKPYEYRREKPEILYLGSSNVHVGFKPMCGVEDFPCGAYNMGLSMLTLPNMLDYFRFVCRVHKPEIIYLCINPSMFTKKFLYTYRQGFSEERLMSLEKGGVSFFLQIIRDSFNLHDVYGVTVSESYIHRNEGELFRYGWDQKRGGAKSIDPKVYYEYISMMVENVDNNKYEYSFEGMEIFKKIIKEANDENIGVVVFFAPLSVDSQAILHLTGNWKTYLHIKRMVTNVIPVYDFDFINELSIHRRAYYYDTSHFRAPLGEKLKPILEGKTPPEPYGYLLSSETVDAALAAEEAAWEKWRAENAEYVQALTECIESGRKPEVGEFAQYIGF